MKKSKKIRYFFVVFTIHFLQDREYIDHSLGDVVIGCNNLSKFSRENCVNTILSLYSEEKHQRLA